MSDDTLSVGFLLITRVIEVFSVATPLTVEDVSKLLQLELGSGRSDMYPSKHFRKVDLVDDSHTIDSWWLISKLQDAC